MKRLWLGVLALCFGVMAWAPAHAQATRTWVSGVGDDANPCSRTAPCKTFAGAISKTATTGEINCLDPAGFGAVTITKSITIDCTGTLGSILSAGTNGIIVNGPSAIVTIRNVSINGAGTGLNGIRILQASRVNLEGVEIVHTTARGIVDERTVAGALLVVKNSVIRNNGQAGIAIGAAATSGTVIENALLTQNQFGLAVATGNNVMVSRSVISGNSTAGVSTDSGGQIALDDSTISHNATGVQSGGSIRLSNTSVAFNNVGFAGAGSTISFGNNRIFGNSTVGPLPTAAGGASTDLGQQ